MISLKKVSAGSGYDYLTRQVAAQDSTIKTGLAAYYEEKGESPGVWMGTGLTGLDGLSAGDPVTEAQMKALFGNGHHPLADQISQGDLADYMDVWERLLQREVAQMPSHAEFIARNARAPEAA